MWIDGKVREQIAIGLGEQLQLPSADLSLTVDDYLDEREVSEKIKRSQRSNFGKALRALYEATNGESPKTNMRYIDGATREVKSYHPKDRPLFDKVFETMREKGKL